jgi:hypothetical protein
MNPYFARIALGFVAILMCRGRFLKSLAVGFTHFTVQGLLIALVGEAPATGASRLPLAVQVVFFPITALPEHFGILLPLGPLLNSGCVALAFFLVWRAFDRGAPNSGGPGAARSSTTFLGDAFNAVLDVALRHIAGRVQARGGLPDSWRGLVNNVASGSVKVQDAEQSVVGWMHSVQAGTTEVQNVQDGARYWVFVGKGLWGMWTVTIAARGFLRIKRMVYTLCLLTPDLASKFGDLLFKATPDSRQFKWVTVSAFTEEDLEALRHFVSTVVRASPRDQWDSLIAHEIHHRFNEVAPAETR